MPGYSDEGGSGLAANPLDEQGRPIYGSKGLDRPGFYGPDTAFDYGGKQFYRVQSPADYSAGVNPQFAGSLQYDPTYGYIAPLENTQTPEYQQRVAAAQAHNKSESGIGGMLKAAAPVLLAAGIGGGLSGLGFGADAAAGAGSVGAPASSFLGAPVDTGLGSWSVGTDALLGGAGTDAAAIQGAFPMTAGMEGAGLAAGASGAIAPSLGGPFVDNFNMLDPSTYSGAGAAPGMTPPGAGAGTGMSFIDGTNPMASLSPDVAKMLGIAPVDTGLGTLNLEGPALNFTGPSTTSPIATGGFGMGEVGNMVNFSDIPPGTGTAAEDLLKKAKGGDSGVPDWLNPRNALAAAGLGLSAAQAMKKPQLPDAAKTVQSANTPIPAAAAATINSGGTGSPAWATQKAAIDSKIDQQIAQAKQAILQKMQNSGMGPDSLVAQQQIQQAVQQLEGMRQQQYAAAQAQNVQAALSEMGMANSALSGVAGMQFKASDEAQNQAKETAKLTMMLYQLMNPTATAQGQQPKAP